MAGIMERPRGSILPYNRSAMLLSGPFGIWPFPILNTFLMFAQMRRGREEEPQRPSLTTYEVNRDEMGRITNVTLLENIGGRREQG